MRIGITYDLKTEAESADSRFPNDFQEEFDSPATIKAIADVLRDLGHVVDKLGDGRELLEQLLADPPECSGFPIPARTRSHSLPLSTKTVPNGSSNLPGSPSLAGSLSKVQSPKSKVTGRTLDSRSL
jgi:hypothetical protein